MKCSTSRKALCEYEHTYKDGVVLQLFESLRDKHIEHQINMVQLALEDIQGEIWSLHKAITLDRT